MTRRVLIVALLASGGCVAANPAFGDDAPDAVGGARSDGSGTDGGSTSDDDSAASAGADGESGRGDGSTSDAEPFDPIDDSEDEVEEDEDLPLFALSFDAQTWPDIGAGPATVGDDAPELVEGTDDAGARFAGGSQWVAFPQHDGATTNVDHRRGTIALDVRREASDFHLETLEFFSLSGVEVDGGGLRFGEGGLLEGGRLRVEYIDAAGTSHTTRFPGGLLERGEWVHLELSWSADVAEGEPNIQLWVEGEPIEPQDGFAAGPKDVGDASAQDVIIFGSWSLGGGSARASLDEIVIFDR